MTGGRPDDGPLAWNVAGLLADEPGAERIHEVAGVVIDLDDLTLAEPISGRIRLLRTNRGILATGDLHAALQLECSRCLRDITYPVDVAHRRGVPAGHRPHHGAPAADRRRAGHRSPDRPPRARPRDAGPRGDPAGGADRAARSARLPGPVHRLRPAARRGRPRPSRRRHRPATRGPPGLHAGRWLTDGPSRRSRRRRSPSHAPISRSRPSSTDAARSSPRSSRSASSWASSPFASRVDRGWISTSTSSLMSAATSSTRACPCGPMPSPADRALLRPHAAVRLFRRRDDRDRRADRAAPSFDDCWSSAC